MKKVENENTTLVGFITEGIYSRLGNTIKNNFDSSGITEKHSGKLYLDVETSMLTFVAYLDDVMLFTRDRLEFGLEDKELLQEVKDSLYDKDLGFISIQVVDTSEQLDK